MRNKLLDRVFGRQLTTKPWSWEDIEAVWLEDYSDVVQQAVEQLPQMPAEWLGAGPSDDFTAQMPETDWFTVSITSPDLGTRRYLVSTEGASYCRYALRLR